MQAPDGGVYFRVSPATWSQGMPGDEHNTLYVSEKTTQATALFAESMAMAARNFKKFDGSYASSCLEKARSAWAFLKDHPTPTAHSKDRPSGSQGCVASRWNGLWFRRAIIPTGLYFKTAQIIKTRVTPPGFTMKWGSRSEQFPLPGSHLKPSDWLLACMSFDCLERKVKTTVAKGF